MDTDICASCGNEGVLYEKTGWCLECSGRALGIHLAVCDICHHVRTVDYEGRKTCSTCRERKHDYMRACGVCDTGMRRKDKLMCDDCQEKYGHIASRWAYLAKSHTKRYGWSIYKRQNWLRKKVRSVLDSDKANV